MQEKNVPIHHLLWEAKRFKLVWTSKDVKQTNQPTKKTSQNQNHFLNKCLLYGVEKLFMIRSIQTTRSSHHFNIIIMPLLWSDLKTVFRMSKSNYTPLPNQCLPGGNLLFSISIATTFTMSTHIGQSNISISDLTNATSERHCVSNLLRSGYARLNSRFTFDWNFFISNNCNETNREWEYGFKNLKKKNW